MSARKGDEPGGENAGAHRIARKGDGASNSPNHALAQIPFPKPETALALLNAALELDVRVGAAPDGSELLAVIPMKVPREISRWFERELSIRQHEIIDYILKENAGGRS